MSERPTTSSVTRVLFLGFGMPPYFRDFLTRLQNTPDHEVFHVGTAGANRHLGAGVHEDHSGIDFVSTLLPDERVPARRIFGLADLERHPWYERFPDLPDHLRRTRPHVIVVNVNYRNAFAWDPPLRAAIRQLGIRVVFHSIPFALIPQAAVLEQLSVPTRLALKSLGAVGRLIRALQLDRLYAAAVRGPALRRQVAHMRDVFQTADAHAVYHDAGIAIYTSYGVASDRIHVVRNSPDTERLAEAHAEALRRPPIRPPNPHRLLHVGRLVQWKRVDLLVEAVKRLRDTGFASAELVVIGYGPEEDALKALAEARGVSDAVIFVGGVYEPVDLARYFASSAFYVLAGMGGLSLNDAMACACPVVCSRCDGTETFLVRAGVTGAFFKEGNIDDLTTTLRQLLRDPERAQTLGQNARKLIDEELNIHTLIENYRRLFVNVQNPPLPK